MENIVNLIVNNGVAVAVVGYFLYTNYKFNEKLVSTLTAIETRLQSIEREVNTNGKSKRCYARKSKT